jgi:hypothetical protein
MITLAQAAEPPVPSRHGCAARGAGCGRRGDRDVARAQRHLGDCVGAIKLATIVVYVLNERRHMRSRLCSFTS